MKLLRLKLENFRQHRDSDIHFAQGMTAIVGVNGSGKTTILEAITFALYGVQRKTKESVKFYWAEQRSKIRVLLEFEFEDRAYILERTGTDASLIDATVEPRVVKASGLREVKAACERLLRLTYDQFKNSFCAEQKSLTFLQFNTDTRRQEQVAKMLGFDRLKLAADLARERGKVFRGIADQFAATLGNIDQLRADYGLAKDEVKSQLALKKQIEELRVELAKQFAPAEERKGLADRFFLLSQEASVFSGKAEALKSYRKRAEDALTKATAEVDRRMVLLPAHAECEQIEVSVREMQGLREQEIDREKGLAELSRLTEEIADLEAKIAALKIVDVEAARKVWQTATAAQIKAATTVREAEAAWSKARQAAQASLSTAQSELKQAQQAFDKAKDLVEKGICPECGQPTSASFEEKLSRLSAELKGTQDEFAKAEAGFRDAEARPKPVFAAEDALGVAQAACAKAQDDLTVAEKGESQARGMREEHALKEKRAELLKADLSKVAPLYNRDAHSKAEARLRELRPLREECLKLAGADETLKAAQAAFDEAKSEIEAARASCHALIADRAKLPFDSPEQASTAIADFQSLSRRIADAEAQEKHADALVKLAESNLAAIDGKIKVYEQTEASMKESRSQALLHETAEKELKLLREELNSVIRPDLASRASENLSLLTNGRYPVLELDEEFNATVIEDGIEKQVISGGEEDVVALALRMALSELIQERQGRPMSLMILDEVFGSLDADRRQAVLERLQAIKGRFAQILVISHIEEINQVADQCIFLSRDERTRSTVIGDLPLDVDELVLRA